MSGRRNEIRVEPHPRGHIAQCNGRLELVKARVVACAVGDDVKDIKEEERRSEELKKYKQERLLAFQRDVKKRVRRKERARQRQLAREEMTLDHPERYSNRCLEQCDVVQPVELAREARMKLLSVSQPGIHLPHLHTNREDIDLANKRTLTPASPPGEQVKKRIIRRMCLDPDREALDRQKEQAKQLHQFHRLYSQLERQQVRQTKVRQTLVEEACQRKKHNEIIRRMAEEEEEEEDSVMVSIGSWKEEEMEKLEEWHQTLALEKRRHQLQTAKETERYLEALRAQLRERLSSKSLPPPPPLCLCASLFWDTDPITCANNCPFYHNPKAYAGALSNILVSLKR